MVDSQFVGAQPLALLPHGRLDCATASLFGLQLLAPETPLSLAEFGLHLLDRTAKVP